MFKDSDNSSGPKPFRRTGPIAFYVPSRIRIPKSDRPQTFTKIFRWRLPAGQTHEPATVEVAGTFTKWQKVPLIRDDAQHAWHVTLHDLPVNRTHHYMLLVDGKPVYDEHCDGLVPPGNAREAQYALKTERGPRVLMLFAQTK
jgi:hypothetical protein